jgi:hypothetical protein
MSFSDFKYILKNYYLTIKGSLIFKLKPYWSKVKRSDLAIKFKRWTSLFLPLILIIWYVASEILFLIQKTINISKSLANWWFLIFIGIILLIFIILGLVVWFLKKH